MGWAKRLRHELWVSIGSWRGFGIGGIQRSEFAATPPNGLESAGLGRTDSLCADEPLLTTGICALKANRMGEWICLCFVFACSLPSGELKQLR
jgi:hypothetical protein